jgi:hypothetical protein
LILNSTKPGLKLLQVLTAFLVLLPAQNWADALPSLSGKLVLQTENALSIKVHRDDYKFSHNSKLKVNFLPPFEFNFVQDGDFLIPLRRGSIPSSHPNWEYILEPGRVNSNKDQPSIRRVSLPFTLQERNANCMHNGVLDFTIDANDKASNATVSISSETCMYFKFDLTGKLPTKYIPGEIAQTPDVIDRFHRQRDSKLERASFSTLSQKYPQVDLSAFAGEGKLPAADISVYGFVIDDVHYRSDCPTRTEDYPFCAEISLPSYSTAKTFFAALATMRLEKLYPGSKNTFIADYVAECRNDARWSDVTLSHALNMVTGNFGSDKGRDDEASEETDARFFFADTHAGKVDYSCTAWSQQATPGTHWVYHTTDTYLLGTALSSLLRQKQGENADLYRDIILPLWADMNLNPAIEVVRRSYDDRQQAFTGFGMTLTPDDVARLGTALNKDAFSQQLDSTMYNSAMQRMHRPQGSYPVDGLFYYKNGFWALDAQELLGCDTPTPVPFMSGYGGINVVMMPNDTVYYIFSDSGKFAWADMLLQSHRIRSMCHNNNNN